MNGGFYFTVLFWGVTHRRVECGPALPLRYVVLFDW